MIGNIVFFFQNVFVEMRQICDEILISNEVIDSRLKSGSNGINLCKLDIQKAYDHAYWSLLLVVLDKMSFSYELIEWINWCISKVNFQFWWMRPQLAFSITLKGSGKETLYFLIYLLWLWRLLAFLSGRQRYQRMWYTNFCEASKDQLLHLH